MYGPLNVKIMNCVLLFVVYCILTWVGWSIYLSYCCHYDVYFMSSNIVKCVEPRSIFGRNMVKISVRRAFIVTAIVCGCS